MVVAGIFLTGLVSQSRSVVCTHSVCKYVCMLSLLCVHIHSLWIRRARNRWYVHVFLFSCDLTICGKSNADWTLNGRGGKKKWEEQKNGQNSGNGSREYIFIHIRFKLFKLKSKTHFYRDVIEWKWMTAMHGNLALSFYVLVTAVCSITDVCFVSSFVCFFFLSQAIFGELRGTFMWFYSGFYYSLWNAFK